MKCFIIFFKKIALLGIESRFCKTGNLRTAPKANGCDLPMGQRQHPAMRVRRPIGRPRTSALQKSLARRKEHCPCPETLGQLPCVEWPDEAGFYSSLVLRQVRTKFQPGWKSIERGSSPSEWKNVDPSIAAQRTKSALQLEATLTADEVACSGTARLLETLLAELAQRHAQTPLCRGGARNHG